MKPKLTLRDLFWLVLVCAMGCAWWVERAKVQEIQEIQDTELRLGPFLVGDMFFPDLKPDETIEVNVKDGLDTFVVRVKKAGRTVVEKEFGSFFGTYKCGITTSRKNSP